MCCCFYASCFCFATCSAGKSCYAVYCTGRFGCSLSVIPSMVAGFFYGLTICQSLSTISTICISCITIFAAGCVFFLADFSMLMSCCCNARSFGFGTYTTSKCSNTFRCTGRFCCDLSFIPSMSS